MKKNLKYLIIGGTAVASVVIVAAPIAATSKYTYPSDPLEVVTKDLNQITNAAFAQGTFDYSTKYEDLKKQVLNKEKDGWNVDGFIDFFKGQQGSYEKVSFPDTEIKVTKIVPNDEQKSFDVFFYVQSKNKNDRGDIVKSSVSKATITFGYKLDLNLAAFANDVTRGSFIDSKTSSSDNQASALKAYTLADVNENTPTDRIISELTPVKDFINDVNSASSSDDAITKLSKYFNFSTILEKINTSNKNQINTITTPANTQSGVQTTQDKTTTTNEHRYKVSLIKDPDNQENYITLVNGGTSARIFLQTEFSDAFKAKYQQLADINARHIDILEIPLNKFASSSLALQFAATPTLQYYTAPATTTEENTTAGEGSTEGQTQASGDKAAEEGKQTPAPEQKAEESTTQKATEGQDSSSGEQHTTGGTTTTADTTITTSETTPAVNKLDLATQNPIDWIFAYNSFFFPNKEYKNQFAKLYVEASLQRPLSIQDFTFTEENAANRAAVDANLSKLRSEVTINGDSLGLEYKDGKVVATATGSITVKSPEGTTLFTKDFSLTLDNFKTTGQSQLNLLIDQLEKAKATTPETTTKGSAAKTTEHSASDSAGTTGTSGAGNGAAHTDTSAGDASQSQTSQAGGAAGKANTESQTQNGGGSADGQPIQGVSDAQAHHTSTEAGSTTGESHTTTQQPSSNTHQSAQQPDTKTDSTDSKYLLFQPDHKFGSEALDFSKISTAIALKDSQYIKSVFTDPTKTKVRFYTGERLEALTSKFVLPTTEQIKNSFSLDTTKDNKSKGIFNIKSSFLPTDLSVSRYYFALANQGLDVAAEQLLEILQAANLIKDPSALTKLDSSKSIFEQLKQVQLNDVDIQEGTAANKADNMKIFMINQESQKDNVLLLQSALVNPKNNVPYTKIEDSKESDLKVLKSILELNPEEMANSKTNKAELSPFENAAQLLIAMYAKVNLLSTPGLGFPLLPIGKGVKLNYNFAVTPPTTTSGDTTTTETQVQASKANNFEYEYTLGFEGNEKALFESEKDTKTLASVEVGTGTTVDPVAQELNEVLKLAPNLYGRISVSSVDYNSLNTEITADKPVSSATFEKLGLQNLENYIKSYDLDFQLVGATNPVTDSDQLSSYKVVSLVLKKDTYKSTDSIKIFVYKRDDAKPEVQWIVSPTITQGTPTPAKTLAQTLLVSPQGSSKGTGGAPAGTNGSSEGAGQNGHSSPTVQAPSQVTGGSHTTQPQAQNGGGGV